MSINHNILIKLKVWRVLITIKFYKIDILCNISKMNNLDIGIGPISRPCEYLILSNNILLLF